MSHGHHIHFGVYDVRAIKGDVAPENALNDLIASLRALPAVAAVIRDRDSFFDWGTPVHEVNWHAPYEHIVVELITLYGAPLETPAASAALEDVIAALEVEGLHIIIAPFGSVTDADGAPALYVRPPFAVARTAALAA